MAQRLALASILSGYLTWHNSGDAYNVVSDNMPIVKVNDDDSTRLVCMLCCSKCIR